MNSNVRKMTTTGMLCALAYAAATVGRVPLVLFLKYDPKDIVIALSGFLLGPLTALTVALAASFAEFITVSETGVWGLLMNVISSCSFACTASLFYQRRRTLPGAALGLLCGWGCMVAVMLLWNYLITPIYMGYPRQAVAELLLPVFLPFNLVKGGLNAAFTALLYRPAVTALRRSHLIQAKPADGTSRQTTGILLVSLLILTACVLLALTLLGVR
ncbi:ECF transporter S component [Pseudoflavonifractor sp. 524-17]|uniref:ECF transporter S component n=1 Tax=Pseudoflavonifractor sp. 524-17 TaxID=2304577 RepID=UPI001379CF7F|nr:ECF transporter S component [Pseudoflavonifractor sp. 524-17]NCE64791.1 ECF transporter S component [Pseudoflavonifractor sp. 524-17]